MFIRPDKPSPESSLFGVYLMENDNKIAGVLYIYSSLVDIMTRPAHEHAHERDQPAQKWSKFALIYVSNFICIVINLLIKANYQNYQF